MHVLFYEKNHMDFLANSIIFEFDIKKNGLTVQHMARAFGLVGFIISLVTRDYSQMAVTRSLFAQATRFLQR